MIQLNLMKILNSSSFSYFKSKTFFFFNFFSYYLFVQTDFSNSNQFQSGWIISFRNFRFIISFCIVLSLIFIFFYLLFDIMVYSVSYAKKRKIRSRTHKRRTRKLKNCKRSVNYYSIGIFNISLIWYDVEVHFSDVNSFRLNKNRNPLLYWKYSYA